MLNLNLETAKFIEYTRSKEMDNKTCILLSKIKRLFCKRTDK